MRRPNHRRRSFDEAHVTDFRARIDRFLGEYLERIPVAATVIGDHRFDDRWPDVSAAGRAERLVFAERWLDELLALEDLSTDEAIDRDLLVMELDSKRQVRRRTLNYAKQNDDQALEPASMKSGKATTRTMMTPHLKRFGERVPTRRLIRANNV